MTASSREPEAPETEQSKRRLPKGELEWHEYRDSRSVVVRESLIHRYMPFARMLAAKAYARRIDLDADFGDYLQYAIVGLIESVDRFSPDQGVKFETFAGLRIGGSILNGLEHESDRHEQIATRRRLLKERRTSITEGVAKSSGDDPLVRLAEVAIGLAIAFTLEGTGMFADDERADRDSVYEHVELKQLSDRMISLLPRLSENEQFVIRSHYFLHKTFDEVGRDLGLSKGRISQIHSSALKSLRDLASVRSISFLG
jgi:RNA polymerase sigma factor for flagellar operon FliA